MARKQWKIPLYEQIKRSLIDRIKEENWQPGDEIPSERELIKEYNVSRTTVRQAIMELSQAGILETRRGTVARVKDNTKDDFYTQGFVHHEIGQEFSVNVLRSEYLSNHPYSIYHLELNDHETVYFTERIRIADGKPIGIQQMYTPVSIGEMIESEISTWYDIFPFLGMHEVYYSNLKEKISAIIANQHEADLLEIPCGDPLTVVHRTALGKDTKPIEFSVLKYIPDYFNYEVQIGR